MGEDEYAECESLLSFPVNSHYMGAPVCPITHSSVLMWICYEKGKFMKTKRNFHNENGNFLVIFQRED